MMQFCSGQPMQFLSGVDKCELLDRCRFKTQAEARMAVFQFIEGFYNPRRRHSSLGVSSPIAFERQYAATALEPGAHEHAVVLAPVKERPGNVRSCTASVPAVRDSHSTPPTSSFEVFKAIHMVFIIVFIQ